METKKTIEHIALKPGTLEGKVALITGGGRGIGREIALAFAFLGAKLIIVDISDEGAQTCKEIETIGGKCWFIKTDLSHEQEIENTIGIIEKRSIAVDILVNNAIACPVESVEKMSLETWDKTIAVNLRAPFLLTKALLPKFINQKSGTIINLLSSAGSLPPEVGQPFMSAYSASKGGLAAFTLSLAPEVEQQGLHVVGIWVGITDTPGARTAFKILANYLETPFEQFIQSMVSPSKVGGVVAYVATNIDAYNGTNVECEKLMEKLGLIETLPLIPEIPVLVAPAPLKPESDLDIIYRQGVENAENLLAVIYEINSGFNQLPFFVRPLANRAFKLKTGASIKDWEIMINNMIEFQKTWGQANKANEKEKVLSLFMSFKSNYHSIVDSLNKLVIYIVESPKEAARFTKDQKTIDLINETAKRQSSVVKASLSTLELNYKRMQTE